MIINGNLLPRYTQQERKSIFSNSFLWTFAYISGQTDPKK